MTTIALDQMKALGEPVAHPEHEHLAVKSQHQLHSANDDQWNQDEDGAIRIRMGDNIPEFFLQTVLKVRQGDIAFPPELDPCYSGTDCV